MQRAGVVVAGEAVPELVLVLALALVQRVLRRQGQGFPLRAALSGWCRQRWVELQVVVVPHRQPQCGRL